jgi:DNA-directed RNA polymerase specialized sigma24 family protein
MAAWERAREMARRRCATSLARLRAGQGGFYTDDDLWQDLFIEFWQVWREWRASPAPEQELWAAWARRTWGGGRRVLQRAPQRLWAGAEATLPPSTLDLEPAAAEAGAEPTGERLGASARETLTQPDLAPDALAARDALTSLSPLARRALYLAAVEGLPSGVVARRLRLSGPAAARDVLRRARQALRREAAG